MVRLFIEVVDYTYDDATQSGVMTVSIPVIQVPGEWELLVYTPSGEVTVGTIDFQAGTFQRGNAHDPATPGLNIADAMMVLQHLFVTIVEVACVDAVDVDDNGVVSIGDAIRLLQYLFVPGATPPPSPFMTSGFDPTPDGLCCPP